MGQGLVQGHACQAEEPRDICSVAQARARSLTRTCCSSQGEQRQYPKKLIPASAHVVLLPATWEHICAGMSTGGQTQRREDEWVN